jgi:hypothetical protein
LTNEYWPQLNVTKINIPEEIQSIVNNFLLFYNKTFQKRVLQWSFANSYAEVDGKIENKIYTFICNALQAVILISFNKTRSRCVTKNELMEQTGIFDEKDLMSAMEPLFSSRILIKNAIDGNNNMEVTLNQKFNFNSKRVKIVNIPKNDELIKKDKIEDDRTNAIDGTIVRNMKFTQRIHHNELIKRVLEQLEKFKIQIIVNNI